MSCVQGFFYFAFLPVSPASTLLPRYIQLFRSLVKAKNMYTPVLTRQSLTQGSGLQMNEWKCEEAIDRLSTSEVES